MGRSEVSQFTTVFKASEAPKIRRNRQAVACTSCQKRKSRCDRKQPCSACQRRGDETNCRFGPVATSPSVANGSRQEIHNRLGKLEDMVRRLAEQPALASSTTSYSTSQEGGHAIRTPDSDPETSYRGPTSWSTLVDSVQDIRSLLEAGAGTGLGIDEDEPTAVHEIDPIFGETPPVTTESILKVLSPRRDVDRLLTVYFNAKFTSIIALHSHQFKRQYEQFWEAPEKANLLWVSILFSVLSCGAFVAQSKGVPLSSASAGVEPEAYSRMAVRCLVAGRYLEAGRFSVEAILLLTHFCSIRKKDIDPTIWNLYCLTIRLSERQGYHRDPSKLPLRLTPFEAEMRRRVWFSIEIYDLVYSYQNGLPPMTHWDFCDAGPPANLTDDDFDEDSVALTPRPPTDPTPILANVTKSRVLALYRRMLYRVQGVRAVTYGEATALVAELNEWYASIPPCLRYRTIHDTSFSDANHTLMHRIMLEQTYNMSLCLMYRSFLVDGYSDVRFKAASDACRDSAIKMLDIHSEIHREAQPGGRLDGDTYMLTNINLHGFLLSATIICVELSHNRKNMSPDERLHRIKLLRSAYQICMQQIGVSSNARHACRILRAILDKVRTPECQGMLPPDPAWLAPVSESRSPSGPPDAAVADDYTSDVSMNFDELLPLDGFFDETEGLDWNLIDCYLRVEPQLQESMSQDHLSHLGGHF